MFDNNGRSTSMFITIRTSVSDKNMDQKKQNTDFIETFPDISINTLQTYEFVQIYTNT